MTTREQMDIKLICSHVQELEIKMPNVIKIVLTFDQARNLEKSWEEFNAPLVCLGKQIGKYENTRDGNFVQSYKLRDGVTLVFSNQSMPYLLIEADKVDYIERPLEPLDQ
jgi:hypothetical protein